MGTLSQGIDRILDFGVRAKFLTSHGEFSTVNGPESRQNGMTDGPPFHIMKPTPKWHSPFFIPLQHSAGKALPQGGVQFGGGIFFPARVGQYGGGGMGGGGDSCGNLLIELDKTKDDDLKMSHSLATDACTRSVSYDTGQGFQGIFSVLHRKRLWNLRRPFIIDMKEAARMARLRGGCADPGKNIRRIRQLRALREAVVSGRVGISGLTKRLDVKPQEQPAGVAAQAGASITAGTTGFPGATGRLAGAAIASGGGVSGAPVAGTTATGTAATGTAAAGTAATGTAAAGTAATGAATGGIQGATAGVMKTGVPKIMVQPKKAPPKPPPKSPLKAPPKKKAAAKESESSKKKKRLRRLPWTPLFEDKDTEFENAELTVPIDTEAIEADFSTVINPRAQSEAVEKPKIELVKVLPDAKRAYNMSLATAKLSKIGFDVIKTAVRNLDQEVLTSEICRTLIEFTPTPEEVKAVKKYIDEGGDIMKADTAERYVYAVMDIENLSKRLEAHRFAMDFADELISLSKPLKVVIAGGEALRNSKKLPALLFFMTRVGNALYHTDAKGMRITSYSKLLDLRTASRPPKSFIQYIILNDSPQRSLLDLSEELVPLTEAGKIDLTAVEQRITAFVNQFKKVSANVESLALQGDFVIENALIPFVEVARDQIARIQALTVEAHEKYEAAAKLYGENATTLAKLTPQAYFNCAAKFVRDVSGVLKEKKAKKAREDKMTAEKGSNDKQHPEMKKENGKLSANQVIEEVHIKGGVEDVELNTASIQDRRHLTGVETKTLKSKLVDGSVLAKISTVLT